MQLTETQRHYWRKNLRITAILLSIWFFVTFVVIYFARDLNFTFFGWPFSVFLASRINNVGTALVTLTTFVVVAV